MEAPVTKVDLRREQSALYRPTNRDWQPVEVPPQRFLAVDGAGDPNTSADYAEAVEVLYSVAYRVKFASKTALGRDYVVMPLEGLWYADDPAVFVARDKAAFGWTLMIRQPDWVEPALVDEAVATARAKRPRAAYDALRVAEVTEGRCLQVLHVGSYDDEGPLLARLHAQVMPDLGLTFAGHHHEVYLSDPRRTAPERLRTVLRQPVRTAVVDDAHR